ncbi:retrovirus-related Pol polyprotein from transposon 412 [Trichonephila clavipes]|nr:retrovirus-related Pol polyprotein from transposon 412 [Trichonephila clavipes]
MEKFEGVMDEKLRPLKPFLDEFGILRARTKLSFREDTDNFKFPIILPNEHPVVHLMIVRKHEELMHAGVDLAGPLHLKDRRTGWVVLFTCAVFRAVHFELITSLSTPAFLQSLRRFISKRGRPTIIYSENGTNFVGSNSALNSIDWDVVISKANIQKIKCNPPSAAWWGGFWERMIQMLKQILRKMLGRASLYYEELNTVLCECEHVINSRPLTYISEDVNDLSPLTPAMFLQEIETSDVTDIDCLDHQEINKRIRHVQTIREQLRKRFRIEYLGQLREQTQHHRKLRPLTVGEVVVVENSLKNRTLWSLARIIQLIPGKDGHVRVARVKTETGHCRKTQRWENVVKAPKSEGVVDPKSGPTKTWERRTFDKQPLESKNKSAHFSGKGKNIRPLNRDPYKHEGGEDDSLIIPAFEGEGGKSLAEVNGVEFKEEQRKCPDLKPLWDKAQTGIDKEFRIIRGKLVRVAKTKRREEVRQLCVPIKDVEEFVKTCDSYQRVGKPRDKAKAPLKLVPIISEVFSKINIDAVGPLPVSTKQNRYLITSICVASKYPEAIPVESTTSPNVIDALLNIFSRIGFPREIQSDLGTSFASELTTTFFNKFGIKVTRSSVSYPQNNAVERVHRTIKHVIKALCVELGEDWEGVLPLALFSLRTVAHEITGFSPTELVMGKNLSTPNFSLRGMDAGRRHESIGSGIYIAVKL